MTAPAKFLKVLAEDRRPFHGGNGQWPEPGVWTATRIVDPCRSGWHLCRARDVLGWLGPTIWLAEAEDVTELADKVVAGRARLVRQLPWDARSARLFAADCAERVLPLFESAMPGDGRPRAAIVAARAFADGEIDRAELAAAWAAAWAAGDTGDARDAGWAAERAAARAASWSARHAAGAVWDAARAASWAADGDVTWDTAWDAARAAGDAAWDAEHQWQTAHMLDVLGLNPEEVHP